MAGMSMCMKEIKEMVVAAMQSQKTIKQMFGASAVSSLISRRLLKRTFDLSPRYLHADEGSRDTVASLDADNCAPIPTSNTWHLQIPRAFTCRILRFRV
jgi:hypothetical protein